MLGLRPFADENNTTPSEAYFSRVVEIVREAGSLGLYVALVASWGENDGAVGMGPRIFRNDNLELAKNTRGIWDRS